jgi:hypothetical protein
MIIIAGPRAAGSCGRPVRRQTIRVTVTFRGPGRPGPAPVRALAVNFGLSLSELGMISALVLLRLGLERDLDPSQLSDLAATGTGSPVLTQGLGTNPGPLTNWVDS